MELTEIRITLGSPDEMPLCGYCSVTFDHCFVVHDLRILRQNDRIFVAMPSRKRMIACPLCHQKNAVQSRYCNNCGRGLKQAGSGGADSAGRLYNDIAHPVNSEFRDLLEQAILREYREAVAEIEAERATSTSKRPIVLSRKPAETNKSVHPKGDPSSSKPPQSADLGVPNIPPKDGGSQSLGSNTGLPPTSPHFLKSPQIESAVKPINEEG